MVPGDFLSFIYLGRCYQLISFISPLPLVLHTGPSVPVLLIVSSPTISQPYYVLGTVPARPWQLKMTEPWSHCPGLSPQKGSDPWPVQGALPSRELCSVLRPCAPASPGCLGNLELAHWQCKGPTQASAFPQELQGSVHRKR